MSMRSTRCSGIQRCTTPSSSRGILSSFATVSARQVRSQRMGADWWWYIGLYGFDVRGPTFFRLHYWGDLLKILRGTVGAEVFVTAVPGYAQSTCTLSSRV